MNLTALPGLSIVGRVQLDLEGVTDGSEEFVATAQQVPNGELWLLTRIVITSEAAVDHGFHLYRNAAENRRLIDSSGIGRLDAADYDGNVILDQGDRLIARWFDTGGAGIACTASITALRGRVAR